MSITEEVAATTGLIPVGAPILPGGTEANIRRMAYGRFYIADVDGYGLAVASPYWIAPAATVAPMLSTAGLELEPGVYECFDGRSTKDRAKVQRLDSEPPTATMTGLVKEAMAAATPVHHQIHAGLPVIAGSWDCKPEAYAYALDNGLALKVAFLDWLTGRAQPEDRAENATSRCNEGVYRLRTGGDGARPMAIWVERYLNVRYLTSASKRTVSQRTLFVLMPVKFPHG